MLALDDPAGRIPGRQLEAGTPQPVEKARAKDLDQGASIEQVTALSSVRLI